MKLSDKIVGLRKSNGMSQEDLAEKLDVSRQAIAFYGAQRSPFCFRTAAFQSQRPPIF